MKRLDTDAKTALKYRLQEDALALAGALFPEKPISYNGHEIRVGCKGGIAINVRSGVWYDHESDAGGDMFDLIIYATGFDFKAALVYAKNWVSEPSKPLPTIAHQSDEQRRENNRHAATKLWNQCSSIGGNHASC